MKTLWDTLSLALANTRHLERQLGSFERLFCAAFRSHHRQIVSSAASLWNTMFKDVEDIAYPEQLKSVLISIRPHIELTLPGLASSSEEPVEHVLSFVDSQDEVLVPKIASGRSSRKSTPRITSRRSNTPTSIAVPVKRLLEPATAAKESEGEAS